MTVGDNLGQGTEAAAAMADVAKSAGGPAQQTVSSGDAAPLAVVCGELTSAGSLSDLSLPEQEDQSLQDLIESELALRIAQSEDLDEDSEASEEDGDVNTRFILAERNHSFQTFTGNDTFFFSTLEDTPPSNGDDAVASPPSPCPPVLAAAVFDPFVTTIVDAESSSPSADSEMVCLAHDAAVGDLVDLDLDLDLPEDPAPASNSMLDVADVDVANSLECSVPTNPPVIPEIDVIPPDDDGCCSDDDDYDPEEEEEELVSSGGQRYFEDEPESEWTTVAEAVGPPRDEQDADDANTRFILAERSAWEPDEPADEHRSGIDHDSEIDQGSQIEHVRAVEPEPELELPEVAPEQGPKDLACEVLAEVVDDDSHDSSSSSEDTESDRDGAKDATLKSSKKKRAEGGDVSKTKKSKKTKKGSDQEKENISVKSSFSKFDQLSKKSVLHVRSVDAAKVQKQFNQTAAASPEQATNCRSCGKQVFQMEQVKAERAVWHKNCFRCKECNKQLTLDIYSSHEGQLYCKPHFRELFKPKAVLEDEHEMPRLRRHELIIRENQPIELPPEVVRASDKPDLGLEELSALNVKSRFQVFEKATEEPAELDRSPSAVNVKRSPSILSKLARFQAKGMDVGVTDESLNGIPFEESSSSSEEEGEDDEGENDKGVVRGSRKQREQPVSFTKMEDMKCRWETGSAARKENLREERKHEISNIRSRLFMGHQGKMKEMYEQAVQESERSAQRKGVDIKSERARSIKEKFERGEVLPDDDPDAAREDATRKAMEEDLSVVEAGISKKSRSLFLELDASAAKNQQPLLPISPVKATPSFREDTRKLFTSRQASEDVVRCSDTVEDVKVETEEVTTKFKFFEGYKPPEKQRRQFRITPPRDGQVKAESPDREIYRDPSVVRCEDKAEDDGELVARSHTTSKMLSLFRQLEENASKEDLPDGPKPLKRFTPPPDCTHESESSEEESDSEDDEDENEEEDERVNPNVVRASDKVEDEFLKQAQNAARAKVLRAKFERWEEKENKANISNTASVNNHVNGVDSERESEHQTSIDTTKSLRARFESLKNETQQPKEKVQRPKVNRFVEIQTSCAEFCSSCEKKVYPLEKVETGGKLFHKQCFRCQQCNCILRMETYTLNGGKPYCLPHFKQLFIAKGNYDEGFGLDQHKRKWRTSSRSDDDFLLNGIDGEASS
ncbi:LIM domain and actin-binding protein 1 isoform X32 [Bacillus rossius redtenbacheri]|uniref:LIM domain and actin-binding protein 1 isoform X32 n=1 Tax=Bacillus rossius redtenbacheri TaxID=93214 RepID=UPI002FDEDAE6